MLKATAAQPNQIYTFVDKGLTTGKYAYRLKQIDFDGTSEYTNEIEVEVKAPMEFALEQNYPNPFNPTTKIRFSIPRSTEYYSVPVKVTLKVYDILGKEVATLVNEEKPAGIYEVEFSASSLRNASELTSGIYMYKLTAGNFTAIRKMMLIK